MPVLHTHLPALHDWVVEHFTPQLPQLFWSAAVLMHWLEQKSWPDGQVQTPPEQDWPVPQVLLQSPQWSALVLKFTHDWVQRYSPVAHLVVQRPAEQTWPLGQAVPHPPQFVEDELVSTHTPLHEV
jgi:hypothetical protein